MTDEFLMQDASIRHPWFAAGSTAADSANPFLLPDIDPTNPPMESMERRQSTVKHLNLELEKLEQRIAPGGVGLLGLGNCGSASGSKDDGSKGSNGDDNGSKDASSGTKDNGSNGSEDHSASEGDDGSKDCASRDDDDCDDDDDDDGGSKDDDCDDDDDDDDGGS
ncbi:MAG TPA: hypothetical protein VFD06_04135, partial [Candidatus Polarisedimenticolia bacterium]|nr:hypothetical protein [Candidatus Polarisedimenticolia bacterium]